MHVMDNFVPLLTLHHDELLWEDQKHWFWLISNTMSMCMQTRWQGILRNAAYLLWDRVSHLPGLYPLDQTTWSESPAGLPASISLVLGLQAHATWLVFSHGFWGWDKGCHTCQESTLQTELPQPQFSPFMCVCVVHVYRCLHMCTCMYVCAYICGDQRLPSSIFLTFHCILFLLSPV